MFRQLRRSIIDGSFITVSVICLLCNVYVVWLTGLESDALQKSYATAEKLRETTRSVLIAVLNAETGAVGYLMSSDELYLSPYYSGTASVGDQLTSLRFLSLDEEQRSIVTHLASLTNTHLEELGTLVDLQRRLGRDAAERRLQMGAGKIGLDTLRAYMDRVTGDLSETMASLQRRSHNYLDISTYSVLFAAFWLYMVIFLAARNPHGDK